MKGEAKFIGITSGCGGVGTSSLALVLGRSLSRFFNKKVLFLSFDLLASKSPAGGGASRKDFFNYYQKVISDCVESEGCLSDFIVSDEYGLDYLKSDSGINVLYTGFENLERVLLNSDLVYDVVILDVPSSQLKGLTMLPVCEYIIMNYGIAKVYQYKYCDEYAEFLKFLCPDSVINKFIAHEDTDSFIEGEVDIHGEFGSEVRALAQKLGF